MADVMPMSCCEAATQNLALVRATRKRTNMCKSVVNRVCQNHIYIHRIYINIRSYVYISTVYIYINIVDVMYFWQGIFWQGNHQSYDHIQIRPTLVVTQLLPASACAVDTGKHCEYGPALCWPWSGLCVTSGTVNTGTALQVSTMRCPFPTRIKMPAQAHLHTHKHTHTRTHTQTHTHTHTHTCTHIYKHSDCSACATILHGSAG